MNISPAHNSPWQPAPTVKTFGSYDQTELRRLLVIDAAAHWRRVTKTPADEKPTQDKIHRREEVATRMAASTRRIRDAQAAMNAEVLGLIAAGAETVVEMERKLGNRIANRSVVDRAIRSLHSTGAIEANGRTRTRGCIWRAA